MDAMEGVGVAILINYFSHREYGVNQGIVFVHCTKFLVAGHGPAMAMALRDKHKFWKSQCFTAIVILP